MNKRVPWGRLLGALEPFIRKVYEATLPLGWSACCRRERSPSQQLEHVKARIRAQVEHPFQLIKNLFRYKKVRYQGIAKNTAQLLTLFTLANIQIAKR